MPMSSVSGPGQGYQSFTHGSLLALTKQALAHALAQEGPRPEQPPLAVDATVGNGHDTLFLAQSVGELGRVFGFDVQADALANATSRLEGAGLAERVRLFHAGHEHMAGLLPANAKGLLLAVTFNLGYLPGGDKTVVTAPQTTLAALNTALDWLAPGGMVSVHCYGGHAGGQAEISAVEDWARALAWPNFKVLRTAQANKPQNPEVLFLVEKKA